MSWFKNLKIAVKLIIAFVLVAIFSGVVGIIGISSINNQSTQTQQVLTYNSSLLDTLVNMTGYYESSRSMLRDLYLSNDPKKRKTFEDTLTKLKNGEKPLLSTLKSLTKEADELAIYDKLVIALNDYNALSDEIIKTVKDEDMKTAYQLLTVKEAEISKNYSMQALAMVGIKAEKAKSYNDSLKTSAEGNIYKMLIVIAIVMLLAVGLGLSLSRYFSRRINKLVESADKLAVGDMNAEADIDTNDELGKLAKSFDKLIKSTREQAAIVERVADSDLTVDIAVRSENDLMGRKLHELTNGLNEVFMEIASASAQVASGSKQISSSSTALSQGATEQASSIEELSASIEEIASQTILNANNANQANELTEKVMINVDQGNKQMKEMLSAMEEINESSANISKIIKVIDDIAFQTNILALNAAVEAARAGQHGKGFAVVAEEVRNLAARSANAAKETTDMIESSIKKTELGTRMARETAEALNKVVDQIEKVSSLVNDITVASNEQNAGIAQINQGIIQVSQVVQTNSATSQESAAASEELSSQAELLQEMVRKVKLKKSHKSLNKLEDISPDILKMLEDMSHKSKTDSFEMNGDISGKPAKKIVLSDNEFGKY